MKYFIISLCAFWGSFYGLCGEHLISHIAEPGWTTKITLYNSTDRDSTFDLLRYSNEGTESEYPDYTVPARSFITLDNNDFGHYGTAKILTSESPSPLSVKLSYQYGDTFSVCEFFIPDSISGQDWVLPNPYESHFDWFGLAAANFSENTITLDLTAWKNSTVVETVSKTIESNRKMVNISTGIWESLNYSDVDRVTIHSNRAISPPISITGNNAQDRHVFFPGQPNTVTDPPVTHTYSVHHVAETVWATTLTIINTKETDAHVSYSSWDWDGSEDTNGIAVSIPAFGERVLTAGTDYSYFTTLILSTEDDILVKLSYQYGNSESICEFFLEEKDSNFWTLPLTNYNWMDWSGIAFSNPYDSAIYVNIFPVYHEQILGGAGYYIPSHTKKVFLFSDLWNALAFPEEIIQDLTMISLQSDKPLQAPIYITGNEQQNRHIFFQGSPEVHDSDFADSAFKTYILEHFDTDEDGTISTSEAEAVTHIDCSFDWGSGRSQIYNLSGVEMFINLEELIFENNMVAWLPDISSLEQLHTIGGANNFLRRIYCNELPPGLDTLDFSNNVITEITQLNLLTELSQLILSGSQLPSLPDISTLTQLTSLDISNNWLSSIPGIEQCTLLEYLYFQNNQFSDCPDFSGLTHLKNIACGDNQLTSLQDFSHLSDLTMLNCQNNSISELNGLGSLVNLGLFKCYNNQLSHLDGLENCSQLFSFDCSDNLITELPDFSNFPSMMYLRVNDLPNLFNLNGINTCASLVQLFATNTGITNFSGLTGLSSLEYFHCSLSPVGSWPDFNTLTSLQHLACFQCGLTELPDVTGCSSLTHFNCSYNLLDSGDCPMIQAIISMGLSSFTYNPQLDEEYLNCD